MRAGVAGMQQGSAWVALCIRLAPLTAFTFSSSAAGQVRPSMAFDRLFSRRQTSPRP